MKPTSLIRWLSPAFAGVLAVQAAQKPFIPGLFVVQYNDDCDPNAVLDEITRKHDVDVHQKLHYKLFKGVEVKFANLQTADSAAADIRTMRNVKRVWQSMAYHAPKTSPRSVGNGDVGHETVKRAVEMEHDTFSTHVMTQVDLLRNAGHVGKGFKIAIIDTGIDYMHPALGGGFGPGHLVSFGTDFVGDNFNGTNTPVPDSDPMDCYGHGTEVAGVIAAQPDKNPYGITGAATGVQLGSYRVYGCAGHGTTDGILIAALHSAFEDGADLIHASLGGPGGWAEDTWSAAVSTIVSKGVPCTLCGGNEGDSGLFDASVGGDAIGAASVASVDNVLAPSLQVNATYSANGGKPVAFGFTPGLLPGERNWTAQRLQLWTPITNISDINGLGGGCDPFPDTTPNLSGSIVLVSQNLCRAFRKATNAAHWGAKHMLVFTDIPGTRNFVDHSEFGMPVGLVSQDQGLEWVKLLLSGAKVEVDMVDVATAPMHLVNYNNTPSGGHPSTFTSWGPTWEMAIKPQFSAPGADILMTFPLALGSYVVSYGTSFAAPLVAAIYVLLMESTGIRDPGVLARLLSSTAKQLDYSNGLQTRVGLPAPVAQQGAGMVQVFEASRARTMFDVDSLAFNDTDHFVAERNFTITNLSNDTLEYRLNHTPAATAYTFDDDASLSPSQKSHHEYPDADWVPNEVVGGHGATLEFSTDSFSIPGGKNQVVSVRVTKPAGLDDGRMPVWSGWIGLTGSDGSKLTLPYQGVTGSLLKRPVIDANTTYLADSNAADELPILGPRTFLLPPPGKSEVPRWSYLNDTDQPTVVVTMHLGSRIVRADLIPVDVPSVKLNLTTVLGTKTMGPLAGWPQRNVPRNDNSVGWDGKLDDGSYAPEGVYKINIKALRIFGDQDKREDYDEVETLEFGIRYALDM